MEQLEQQKKRKPVAGMPTPAGIAANTATNPNQTPAPQSITDISHPANQAQVMRSSPDSPQAKAMTSALGLQTPGNPTTSPDNGITAKPKTVMIGGIPHMDLPDQKFPGPLSMMVGAMADTTKFAVTAPFGNRIDDRLAANRRELNNENLPPEQQAKPTGIAALPPAVPTTATQPASNGRDKNGVITAESAKAAMGADMQRSGGIAGGIDLAAANAVDQRANNVRQQMIDAQVGGGTGKPVSWQDQHGNADPEKQRIADSNALLNKWDKQYQNQQMIAEMGRNPRAAQGIAQLAAAAGHDETVMRGQEIAANNAASSDMTTRRGQDIAANNEAAKLAGNPQEQQLKQAQAQGIMAQTEAGKQITDLRNKLLTETDPAKRTAMQEAMLVAQGRDPSQGRYIRMGGGEQVIDPLTGQKAKLPDQVFDSRTGKTVDSTGKRELSDSDFAAIGKKIGLPGEALKARYEEFKQQGPLTRLSHFNSVDVALALASGTPPEKIAATIKSLGGKPSDYGIDGPSLDDLEHTAKKHGMTVEQVKAKLAQQPTLPPSF